MLEFRIPALLIGCLAAFPVGAQTPFAADDAGVPIAELSFDIGPQSLDTALVAFAKASGIDVLNDNAVTADRQTAGVRGVLAPLAALQQLLAGTGLKALLVHSRAVVIVSKSETEPLAPTQNGAVLALTTLEVRAVAPRIGGEQYAQYANAVRAEIERRLRSIRQSGTASFTAKMRIWIAPDGRISQLEWDREGGARQMNRTIERELQQIQLERPPSERMPQPLRFEIRLE
jgi:hypothetical protein